MNANRVKAHIDSETIRLKQLKPLIGKDVEISVRSAKSGIVVTIREADGKLKKVKKAVRKSKTDWFDERFGAGSDSDLDGFDAARESWRKDDKATLREPLE